MVHFYTPWKDQKAISFMMFLGSMDVKHWAEIG